MSTPYGPTEYELDAATCPECGEIGDWEQCEGWDGEGCSGLIDCVCEGLEGGYVCPFGCEEQVL
jgi:hypothetical protein